MSTSATIPLRAWIDLILLALVWGAIFLFVAIALREMTPFWTVFHRVFWATLLLWLYVWWRGFAAPRGARIWFAFFVMGALNNAIPFTLITWGQTEIESGLASILNSTTAFFGIVVAAIFLADERLTARRIAGVLIGVLGVAVIIGIDALTAFDPRSLGQIAVLGAALSYAFAGVWAKTQMQGLTPTVSAAGMLTGSSVIMGVLALAVEGTPDLTLTWTTIGALAYCATFGTVVTYLLYYRILATAGSGNLLLVTIMMPPISILLGAWVLGEALAPSTYVGCGLIALGLVVLDGRVFRNAKSANT
ncbi:MAG: DMT family transporter [Pseudomonadota bacterium]